MKKTRVIFLCDAKFSSSPKKLGAKLTELMPKHRFITRLKSRPPLKPTKAKRIVLNWGNNINKLQQYNTFQQHNLPHPEWTTDSITAINWLADGDEVVGRSLLNSFGGKGITIYNQDNHLPTTHNNKVFTKYKKKKHEFRIHVFNGQIIDFAQKKKSKEANNNNNVNTKVRNFKNGWVYCREDVTLPNDAPTIAIAAVNALGLKFGAVDIIWNQKENKSYILEVNSAPGLAGSTINSYANAFKSWLINL